MCPHPPLLVPELAAGAASELEPLRARCRDAVAQLHDVRPDVVYVVGADVGLHARGFGPWGADVAVDVPEPLPLSLLVGAWLTRGTARSFVAVAPDLDPDECAALGAELADSAARVGLLVMGDGSARHTEKAPGYIDPRAASYDQEVARALRAADTEGLLRLDPALSDELLVAGRAPWQVLAGAARTRGSSPEVGEPFVEAPYGVGYLVFTWRWQGNG